MFDSELEANLYIKNIYNIDNYIEVTRDVIESINWDNYIATIGTIYERLPVSDTWKVEFLCVRDIMAIIPSYPPHLGDRLNVSYMAPPKFGVRNMAFWEYYDKFPRIVKSLNENDLEKSENEKSIGSSTKFYIHKNYIHVFRPEEVKI